jgi:hypothetical protein
VDSLTVAAFQAHMNECFIGQFDCQFDRLAFNVSHFSGARLATTLTFFVNKIFRMASAQFRTRLSLVSIKVDMQFKSLPAFSTALL